MITLLTGTNAIALLLGAALIATLIVALRPRGLKQPRNAVEGRPDAERLAAKVPFHHDSGATR